MPRIDFDNNRGENLSDPIYDKDAVNKRTLKRHIQTAEGSYLSTVSGGTVNGGISATTISACTGIYTSNLYGCSPLVIHDNTSIDGDLTVSGNTTTTGDLAISGNTTTDGDITTTGNLTVNGNTTTDGDIATTGNLTVGGVSDFQSISATTIYSGSTDLSDIFLTAAEGVNISTNTTNIATNTSDINSIESAWQFFTTDAPSNNGTLTHSGAGTITDWGGVDNAYCEGTFHLIGKTIFMTGTVQFYVLVAPVDVLQWTLPNSYVKQNGVTTTIVLQESGGPTDIVRMDGIGDNNFNLRAPTGGYVTGVNYQYKFNLTFEIE